MRPRRASSSQGIVNRRVRLTHETLLLGLMAIIGLWMVGSLLQAVAMNQSLGGQAAELRDQNASLQSGNDGYRRDIAAIASGGAAEEEARRDGYARSDERLYIVVTPPPPTAPAHPRPRPAAASRAASNPLAGIWHLLTGMPDAP